MVEVCPLTLFHNFFKSILRKPLGFRVFFFLFFSVSCNAHALQREITLFPHQDLQLTDNNDNNKTLRFGVTESIVNTTVFPCLLEFNQIPLLYSVLQLGFTCALPLTAESSFSYSIIPETNYSKEVNKRGLALGVGVAYNYNLFAKNRSWVLFASFNYKFWDNELTDSSYRLSSAQLFQIWGSVFDSNFRFGLLHNFQANSNPEHTEASILIYYLQSIPLEWRQVGGAKNTAALEYKALGFSIRKEFFSHLILGAGAAYWNLTFDGIRISGPLPDVYLGIDF